MTYSDIMNCRKTGLFCIQYRAKGQALIIFLFTRQEHCVWPVKCFLNRRKGGGGVSKSTRVDSTFTHRKRNCTFLCGTISKQQRQLSIHQKHYINFGRKTRLKKSNSSLADTVSELSTWKIIQMWVQTQFSICSN